MFDVDGGGGTAVSFGGGGGLVVFDVDGGGGTAVAFGGGGGFPVSIESSFASSSSSVVATMTSGRSRMMTDPVDRSPTIKRVPSADKDTDAPE